MAEGAARSCSDLVVRPALRDGGGFELDANGTFESRLEPQRHARGHVDVENAIGGADATGLFSFDVPLIEPMAKVVGVNERKGVTGTDGATGEREDQRANECAR